MGYPGTDPRGIELLYSMLKFNPKERISADEAIRDPYFDDIRLPEQEVFETTPIKLTFDDEHSASPRTLKKHGLRHIRPLNSNKFDFENDIEESEGEDY